MLKRIFTLIFSFCILTVNACALDGDDISAECSVLMSTQTGEVIFDKNGNSHHSMASTTKIMTALLAVESGKLNNEFVVDSESIKVEGTSMGLCEGDTASLLDLTYGMLLPSGNDAANATAVYLSGNISTFVDLMNNKAKQIGMNNTNFVTPSGLDDENHYSTAYDMALLGRYAVKNPQFLSVCSSKSVKLSFGNPPYERWLYNHNKLLSYYEYALGIKTGFTKKSGRCLVSYAEKDGVGLVCVTLNAPNDWSDHKKLLDYGFNTLKTEQIKLNLPSQIAVVGGKSDYLKIDAITYSLSYCNKKQVKFKIYLPKFLYAPVNVGDIIGHADVYYDGEMIDTIYIISNYPIEENSNGR